ncbi:hypothetical protein ONS95_013032 [Cadophora gregata]|uniref:uncharacterized protein n=1 Tax=Cadophora gregata TaxID=51156 RepID=UPI0026DD7E5A|nr:uncharacterized protein ONS95_013032 [Cadophora gregata]KAK0100979.1 hypothetical protein ONS96_014953 [Cadophora gregata f. sp. sojae]KAK0115995.1 hypothetical protein ONS95_013032 [Cadophora gregata]
MKTSHHITNQFSQSLLAQGHEPKQATFRMMVTPPSISLSSEELTSVTHLLHLFHHRNKNQHRLSKWWKAFSQLRRQVGKLLLEVEALETCVKFSSAPASASASSSKVKKRKGEGSRDEVFRGGGREGESKFVRAARETVEERVEFLENWVVPKCFLAFSNVVADNQYAALGLMLMGTLARLQTVMKDLGRERENGGGDVEEDCEGDEKEIAPLEKDDDARKADLGEVVSREGVLGIEGHVDDEMQLKVSKKLKRRDKAERGEESAIGGEAPPAKRPKKKRKKGGDAFDELFAGLI